MLWRGECLDGDLKGNSSEMNLSFSLLILVSVMPAATDAAISDAARRWQGAWVVRNAEFPGSVGAWSVHGDSVTVYNPVAQRSEEQEFVLESSCRLVRRQARNLSTVLTTNTFTFAPGGLYVASSHAAGGQRSGSLVTVCVEDDVYTFDTRSGGCQKRNAAAGRSPTAASGECVLDASSFVIRRPGADNDIRLNFSGDALLSPSLAVQLAEPQVSFDQAIARANALVTH
jgi:hypothetical protein